MAWRFINILYFELSLYLYLMQLHITTHDRQGKALNFSWKTFISENLHFYLFAICHNERSSLAYMWPKTSFSSFFCHNDERFSCIKAAPWDDINFDFTSALK